MYKCVIVSRMLSHSWNASSGQGHQQIPPQDSASNWWSLWRRSFFIVKCPSAKHHRSDHRTQSSATANTCRFARKQSFWDMTWLFLIDWFWLNGMFFFRWAQFTVSLIQNALKNSGMFAYRLRISELLICGCTMSSKVLLILELILFLLLLLLLFLLY